MWEKGKKKLHIYIGGIREKVNNLARILKKSNQLQ